MRNVVNIVARQFGRRLRANSRQSLFIRLPHCTKCGKSGHNISTC